MLVRKSSAEGKQNNSNNLTQGGIFRTLCLFALPFLIANVLQALYGAVDLLVVGMFLDAESVAAVSTGTQVTQIITSLISGLTLGSTILVGKYIGRKEETRAAQVIGTSLSVFALAALLLTVLMLCFRDGILRLLSTPHDAFALAGEYVSICACGIFFTCMYNAISAILRGYGDSKSPMVFIAIACALNVVLDFVFVAWFSMGVAGTALATILAQGFSMLIAVAQLRRSHFLFDFRLRSFRIDPALFKELAFVGIPVSLQELMIRISFLYLTAVMNRCGVFAAAVVGIGSKYDVFAMLPATSIAGALAALTAQNMGAGKPERARKALWYGLGFALSLASVFWLWAQLAPESMLAVFTQDADIISAGIPFFRACSYDYLAVSFVFCLNGYLNGKSQTVLTMASSCFGALCLRIPLISLFAANFPDDLGRLGMIAPTVSGIMAVYTLFYVLWKDRRTGG